MAGVFGIMIWQSPRLSVVALLLLPFYLLLAVRSARKLETGMDGYYQMWEDVSARIQDALASVKTVKLSGAEPREAEKLRSVSTGPTTTIWPATGCRTAISSGRSSSATSARRSSSATADGSSSSGSSLRATSSCSSPTSTGSTPPSIPSAAWP